MSQAAARTPAGPCKRLGEPCDCLSQSRSERGCARRGEVGPVASRAVQRTTVRIDALLDLIESDADKIVWRRAQSKASQRTAAPVVRSVDGMLSQVDCLGNQARLHIAVPSGKVLLLVRDRDLFVCVAAPVLRRSLRVGR